MPHKVGLTSAALGLASLALPFASVSRSRIATGTQLHAWDALGVGTLLVLAAAWVVLAALSGRRGARGLTTVRGLVAAALIPALVWISALAAARLVPGYGTFARYSLGAGVWLGAFAAFALVIASRRELGPSTPSAWLVTLSAPAAIALLVATGELDGLGIMVEYRNLGARFWPAVGEHVAYSASAILVASVLGVALGVLAFRVRRLERPVFTVVSAFQTVPGLALIGIMVVPLAALSRAVPGLRDLGIGGLGWAPVVISLTLYALLSVVRNTYAGLANVPSATVDAGRGMGMTGPQVLRRIQAPLALPIIFSGVRTASQQTVGNATLGAFVAAGGLGPLIFLGLAQQANDLVLLGSISLVALALSVDIAMRALQRAVTPRGVGGRGR